MGHCTGVLYCQKWWECAAKDVNSVAGRNLLDWFSHMEKGQSNNYKQGLDWESLDLIAVYSSLLYWNNTANTVIYCRLPVWHCYLGNVWWYYTLILWQYYLITVWLLFGAI